MKKRILSFLMAWAMCVQMLPLGAFAAVDDATNLCEHHTAHDETCGYAAAVPGVPCGHGHGDGCYTTKTECTHTHGEACCQVSAEGDLLTDTCNHVCTADAGCVTRVENCTHVHDADCGFAEAVEGEPCSFACAECAAHTHVWVAEWSRDDFHHWKKCVADDGVMGLHAPHNYVDGKCVCGAEDPNYVAPTPTWTTVYFVNTSNWGQVNAYAWDSKSEVNGKALSENHAWPGEAMTKVEDTDNGYAVYSYKVSSDFDRVIFNNGGQGQTGNIDMPTGDKNAWTWGGTEWVTLEEAMNPGTTEPTTPTTPTGKTIVYFDNTNTRWETVYAYAWEEGNGSNNANWPGKPMTKVEGTDNIYFYEVSATFGNIIFNNGNDVQTGDLTVPTDGNTAYNFRSNTWTAPEESWVSPMDYTIYAAGDGWLGNNLWNASGSANELEQIRYGVYQIAYTGVPVGTHQFKFTTADWGLSWGGAFAGFNKVTPAECTDQNIEFTIEREPADITLTLDLTNFDASTKEGATFTVTSSAVAPAAYTLTFAPNAGEDQVTNLPGEVGCPEGANNAAIDWNSVPKRTGYTFLGYARTADAAAPDYPYDAANPTPITFTIGEDTTLYAIWEQVPPHEAHADGKTFDTPWSGDMEGTILAESANIYLNADVTISGELRINEGVTVNLCLNGYTLNLGSNYIGNKGTLNIYSCRNGGTIRADGIVNHQTGTLNLYSGTVETTSTRTQFTTIGNSGTITMFGGQVIANDGRGSTAIGNLSKGEGVGTLTIKGGTVTGSTQGYGIVDDFIAGNPTPQMYIEGGTITGDTAVLSIGNLHVSGGTLTGTVYGIRNSGTAFLSGDPAISGGTADICNGVRNDGTAPMLYGTATMDAGSDRYTGEKLSVYLVYYPEGQPVVYNATADKFASANSSDSFVQGTGENANHLLLGDHAHGETTFDTKWHNSHGTETISGSANIALDNNIQFSGDLTIAENATVTICLAGKTLNMLSSKIVNNGNLTICDCMGSGKVTGASSSTIVNNGTLTVESGTVENTGENAACAIENNGAMTLTSGTVEFVTGADSSAAIVNAADATLNIQGGNVKGKNGIDTLGTLNVSAGTVTGTVANGICVQVYGDAIGTANISGGTVNGNRNAIYSDGRVCLSGAPVFASGTAVMYHGGQLFASIDGKPYVGRTLSLELHSALQNQDMIIVGNVTADNAALFTLVGASGTLTLSDGNLIYTTHNHDDVTFDEKLQGEIPGSLTTGSYILTGDAKIGSSGLTIPENVTVDLCLNGHTLTMYAGKKIEVQAGATLNIYDCSPAGTGQISCQGNAISVHGTLNLHSGTIACAGSQAISMVSGSEARVNIYGGKVTASSQYAIRVAYGNQLHVYGGTISGGTADKDYYFAIHNKNGGVYLSGNPTLTGGRGAISMEGGDATIYAADDGKPYEGEKLALGLVESFRNGAVLVQNVTAENKDKFALVNSGTQSLAWDAEKQTLNLAHFHDGVTYDTIWSGSTVSADIQADARIVLTEDVTASSQITIASGVTVTLCLNGHTLDLDTAGIVNNGTLHICDCQATPGKITSAYLETLTNRGTLTVTGVTMENTYNGRGSGIQNNGRIATLKNATVTSMGGRAISNNQGSTLNVSDCILTGASDSEGIANGGKATIAGSTVTGETGILSSGTLTVTSGTITGSAMGIENLSNGTVNVQGGTVNGSQYGIYSSANKGTVNVTGGTVTGPTGIMNTSGTVTISGDAEVTGVQNGINNKSSLTVNGGTITGPSTAGSGIHNDGGTVTVTSGNIEGRTGIATNRGSLAVSGGNISGNQGIVIGLQNVSAEISGGTITGTQDSIYNDAGVTVSGTASIIGGETGITNYATLNVSGGSITASGQPGRAIFQLAGTCTVSAGYVKGNHSGIYVSDGSCAISGGTVTCQGEFNQAVQIVKGSLTVSGSAVINGTSTGISCIGGNSKQVTVTGGKIQASYLAIHCDDGTVIRVTGGEIISGADAILTRHELYLSGEPKITGYIEHMSGTICATAEKELSSAPYAGSNLTLWTSSATLGQVIVYNGAQAKDKFTLSSTDCTLTPGTGSNIDHLILSPNPFTVTFHPNGGVGTAFTRETTYNYNWQGAQVTTPWDDSGFTKEGYTLMGWSNDPNYDGTTTNWDDSEGWAEPAAGTVFYSRFGKSEAMRVDSEVTFYAIWAENTLEMNGKGYPFLAVAHQEAKGGETIKVLKDYKDYPWDSKDAGHGVFWEKSATLNLNGKTITNVQITVTSRDETPSLTITDGTLVGMITNEHTATLKNVTMNGLLMNAGDMTIDGGTYNGVFDMGTGSLTLVNGTFNPAQGYPEGIGAVYNGKSILFTYDGRGEAPTLDELKAALLAAPAAGKVYSLDADRIVTEKLMGELDVAYFGETVTIVNDSIDSVKITKNPDKMVYTHGEKFDPTGMVVTATYKSGSTKDVTKDVTFYYSTDTLTAGQTSLAMSYKEDSSVYNFDLNGLTVNKVQLNVSGVKWVIPDGLTYNGQPQSIGLSELPEGVTAQLAGNTETNAGTYTATATFALAEGYSSDNYEITGIPEGGMTTKWSIAKANPTADHFTFTKPENLTYTGQGKEADIGFATGYTGTGNVTVKYYQGGEVLSGAPTDVGTYTVRVDVTEGDNFIAAQDITADSWQYEITPAKLQVTVMQSGTQSYTGEAQAIGIYATGVSVNRRPITFLFSTSEDGNYSSNLPSFTDAGTYTVYYEASAENHETVRDSLQVTIKKATNEWIMEPSIQGWTYGEQANEPTEAMSIFGDVSFLYRAAGAETWSDTVPTQAGEYQMLAKVEQIDNWTGLEEIVNFTIAKKSLTPAISGTLTKVYDGKTTVSDDVAIILSGAVSGEAPTATATFAYDSSNVGSRTITASSITLDVPWRNNYTLTKGAVTANGEITKAVVTEPTIPGQVYNGREQTADVPQNSLYSVKENNGGTDRGDYDVVLELTDSANYKWSTVDTATVTLTFTISKGENTWTAQPDITSWIYGAPNEPVGKAKFGTVNFTWYDSEKTLLSGKPVNAGSYYMTVSVAADGENYDAISKEYIAFTISKAALTPVIQLDKDSKPYDGTTAVTGARIVLTGAVGEEKPTASADFVYDKANVTEASKILATNITLAGDWGVNYELTATTAEIAAAITKANAVITVDQTPIVKTYGESWTLPAASSNFGTVTCDKTTADMENAGSYTVTYSVEGTDNYIGDTRTVPVTIQKAEQEAPDMGEGYTINYRMETITIEDGYEVATAQTGGEAVASGAAVTPGTTLYIRKCEQENHNPSDWTEINVASRPAQPQGIAKTDETILGLADGKISGITADMEYKIGDGAWVTGDGEDITDLGAVTVSVRIKATDTAFHGETLTITLNAGAGLTVTFDSKGGSNVETATGIAYDTAVAAPTAPTKNGYTFDGWYTDAACTTAYDFTAKVTQSFILYAKWNVVEYTITYHLNGGANPVGAASTYTVESSTIALPTPTKAVYRFEGWYLEDTFQTKATEIPAGSTGSKVFYAKWTQVEYTIIQGAGQTVTKGNSATFTSDAPFRKFVEVQVDGERLDGSCYRAEESSTKVTLTASFIKTLSVGEHTLRIVADDGWAETTFKVKARPTDSGSPETGDITQPGLWIALAVVGLLGLTGSITAKKNSRKRK